MAQVFASLGRGCSRRPGHRDRSEPVAKDRSATTVPAPAFARQTMLEEAPTADDKEWASRANGGEASTVSASKSDGITANFGFCHTGGGYNCVVDGDTIWIEGQDIRIADIDAPETHEYDCASEKELATEPLSG